MAQTYAERHPSALVHGDRFVIEGRGLDATFWEDPKASGGIVTRYRKTASVIARKIDYPATVATPEGQMRAEPGDYLVTDDPPTHAWPVRGAVFEATYEPIED